MSSVNRELIETIRGFAKARVRQNVELPLKSVPKAQINILLPLNNDWITSF